MLISIIVPVYNVEKELERCILSLLEQTYRDIQIVLVDDGSMDKSPLICDKYEKLDQRVIVIHKMNGGLSDARNMGLKSALGEYILFVDSDDYIEKETCEKFAHCINGDEVDIVVGEAKIFTKSGIQMQTHRNLEETISYSPKTYLLNAIRAKEWYMPVCYNLYNKTFLDDNQFYFKRDIYHEDLEFLPRVFLSAKKIKYMRFQYYCYVLREGSITQSKAYEKHLKDLFEIYVEWKTLFDTIDDCELRKVLYSILSKYYIATCRQYKDNRRSYPTGISAEFLIQNSLDLKEKLKAICFVIFRGIYVKL